MAYSYVWPTSLPQVPQKGFTETGGVLTIKTSPDQGPAKLRYRGLSPSVMQVTFIMTTTQVATLDNFVQNTVKGVARFGFKHPRTGNIVEVRFVSQQNGTQYNTTYLAPGYWTVSAQFEVLP
jgi:hypothetical protein